MTALSRSTRARLATRIFGTVRNDLNRARTARTKPLPNTEAEKTARILAAIAVTMFLEAIARNGNGPREMQEELWIMLE
ncbi:hypothetical protein OS493_003301 [Desmophyllum pertusum]|uniref:Uncharacterized protein n=1 Tax=Desmophyllum pertusum TaxID=174260 RepID=A0A9X0DB99_9CNID|nr:hypothetical protein OS493_003301 [Desmophyllum pertusum]